MNLVPLGPLGLIYIVCGFALVAVAALSRGDLKIGLCSIALGIVNAALLA